MLCAFSRPCACGGAIRARTCVRPRLRTSGASILFFIVGLAVLFKGFVPAAWLGLALSFAVEMTQFLKHAVRMFAQSEGQMASVERLMQYTGGLDAEEPSHLDADRALAARGPAAADAWAPNWPRGGSVRFDKVVMGYRPGLPDVLQRLSFECAAGEKVGIVGRTGSGKSSVMVALFRFVELRGGTIAVDGQDISSLRLCQLRSCLSIIPQDPVMFSASLRFNLDPFEQHTDAQLWEVLDKVILSTTRPKPIATKHVTSWWKVW